MTARSELDARRVEELLRDLAERLRARGIGGGVRVVGGAAMALLFRDDPEVRVTTDIDALYEPRDEVAAVIAEMAAERQLPGDWLNAAAGAWVARRGFAESGGFVVEVASAEEPVAIAYRYCGEDSVELSWPREEYLEIPADVLREARR